MIGLINIKCAALPQTMASNDKSLARNGSALARVGDKEPRSKNQR